MIRYYIRTAQSDRSILLALAVTIGVLRQVADEGGVAHYQPTILGAVWDEIGLLSRPTGTLDGDGFPIHEPVTVNGEVAWHANLYLPDGLSLMEMAQAAYAANPSPALADALSHVPRFFVADPVTGEAIAPLHPARVLFE